MSVVLSAREEEACIGLCLDDLLAQTYPLEDYEVIVVDDGSTDGTAEVVGKAMESGAAVRLLHRRGRGDRAGSKKAALSLGIEAARGEIILTTDADCRLPPTWVRCMVDCFAADVGMVVGFSQSGHPGAVGGVRQGWEAVDFLCLMASAAGSAGHGHPMGASGQNLAYRKLAYDQVEGFRRVQHRASGDDVLLLHLIRRLTNWRVIFAADPGAFALHPPSSSWQELLSRRSRWASNAPYQLYMDPLFFVYLLSAFGSQPSAGCSVFAGAVQGSESCRTGNRLGSQSNGRRNSLQPRRALFRPTRSPSLLPDLGPGTAALYGFDRRLGNSGSVRLEGQAPPLGPEYLSGRRGSPGPEGSQSSQGSPLPAGNVVAGSLGLGEGALQQPVAHTPSRDHKAGTP